MIHFRTTYGRNNRENPPILEPNEICATKHHHSTSKTESPKNQLKAIMKYKTKINEIGNKRIQRINKTKNGFFEEIRTHYSFTKLSKRKNTDQNE